MKEQNEIINNEVNDEIINNNKIKSNDEMRNSVKISEKNESNENSRHKENKMGVMPVNRLLISMSLPIMVSMLVQAIYNVVDSIFVAQLSEEAFTAVSLAFPVQNLMIAVGAGTGVGINAVLSRSLGEKDFEKANRTAVNGVFLAFLSYLLFLGIGVFAVIPFYMSQNATGEIFTSGVQYLTICCTCSFGVFTQMTFERLLQSTGKTFYSMITQLTGAIINIILDPIMIFGLFGFPRWGVAGAAIATVIGQCVAGALAIILNEKVNKEISVKIKGFRPNLAIIKRIYSVGIPSIIMQAIGSVMTYGFNRILIGFSFTATAVFGAYFKLQSFIFMPIFGLNNGMIPIIAYNYGAKDKDRMIQTLKRGMIYAVSIMLGGVFVFQVIPAQLLRLFDASENMIEMGVPALRIISISFIMAGFCIVSSALFQAVGNGLYSMLVSVARQLVVLLPVAFLLSKTVNLDAVWWAFPIADVMSVTMTVLFLIRINKGILKKLA